MRVCYWSWVTARLRVVFFALLFLAVGNALARGDTAWRAPSKLSIALAASGVHDPAHCERYNVHWESLVDQLRRENITSASARDRAARVMAHLHREVLTGEFDARCESVAATLDGQCYNCVTATILFCILAEAIDLPVTAQHAPEHVWVRVDSKIPLTIETTNARWMSHAGDRLLVPRAGRSLSFDELCGKLWYNRGVKAIERADFNAAKDAFAQALQLDSRDAAARQNLLAALNNGALALCHEGNYVGANAWLVAAESIDPNYPPLLVNRKYVSSQADRTRP